MPGAGDRPGGNAACRSRAQRVPPRDTEVKPMSKACLPLFLLSLCLISACASTGPPPKPATADDAYAHAMQYYTIGNYFDAIPAFEELRDKYPLSPYAVLAELRLGESHYHKDEYAEASHYFENFRRLHPSNAQVPYSIYMAGMCSFAQILSADRDQTFAIDAANQFQLLIDLFPASPFAGKAMCKLAQAQKRIAEHQFFVASFYFRQRNFSGAAERYGKILAKYPHALNREQLMYNLAEALILSGDRQRGCAMLHRLLHEFPGGGYTAEARAMLELHETAPEGAAAPQS
jgi:outer membrane protein assembly factor BamD